MTTITQREYTEIIGKLPHAGSQYDLYEDLPVIKVHYLPQDIRTAKKVNISKENSAITEEFIAAKEITFRLVRDMMNFYWEPTEPILIQPYDYKKRLRYI